MRFWFRWRWRRFVNGRRRWSMLVRQRRRTYRNFQRGYLLAQVGNFVTQRRCLLGGFFFCPG
jgi:hypothetical protein